MSTEELLKPRIKVIGPAPLMKNEVGSLLRRMDDGGGYSFGIRTISSQHFYLLDEFKEWPSSFKILEWWEERDIKDMPLFLKFNDDRNAITSFGDDVEPEIHKVKRHWATSMDKHWRYGSKQNFISEWHTTSYCYGAFTPATKEEYDNQ